MYTKSYLNNYDLFKNKTLDLLLDDLTKTLSRPYIIKYIKSLIIKEKPFTLLMLDVDNFKSINDVYGHLAGDEILSLVSSKMLEFVNTKGLIGRYGGDEFLIVLPSFESKIKLNKYLNDFKEFCFLNGFYIKNKQVYITSTIGSVSYPLDGTSYEELFSCVDKVLYFGKEQGRNCFNVYKGRYHENIDITKNISSSLIDMMNKFTNKFNDLNTKDALKQSFDLIAKYSSISNILYLNNNEIISYKEDINISYNIINELYKRKDNIMICQNAEEYLNHNLNLYNLCSLNNIKSFVIISFKIDSLMHYLLFLDSNRKRIWQERELVLFMHFAKILELYLKK